MKKIVCISLGFMFLLASLAPAATKAFYVTDEAGDNLFLVRTKNFDAAPVGLYVQKCISGTAALNDYAPPTNWGWAFSGNAFTNYLPPDCYEYQVGSCKMGDDDAGVGFGSIKAGQVSASVGSSDATRRGWLRCFSGTLITNSAYYGDTPGADLGRTLNNAVDVYQWQNDTIISNINPAYIIPFVIPPPTQSLYATVGGKLLVGASDNVLPETILLVEYRSQSGGPWITIDPSIAAGGDFMGVVGGPFPHSVFIRARVADGESLRVNLPVSEEYPVHVLTPEPGAALGILFLVGAVIRRKAN